MPGYSLRLNIHNIDINYESNQPSFTKELVREFAGFVTEKTEAQNEAIKINFYDLELEPQLTYKMSQLQAGGHKIEQANLQDRITNIVDFTECSLNLFVKQSWNVDEALLLLVGSLAAMLRFRLSQKTKLAIFHAASLALENDGLLLLGDTGAGKTSLSLLCAKAGFTYLTDEYGFIEEIDTQNRQLLAYPRRIRLSAETLAHFPELIDQHDRIRSFDVFNQPGYIIDLHQPAQTANILSAPLKVVVVLRNDKNHTTAHINRLNKSNARLWLLHCLESAVGTDSGWKNLNRQGFYLVDNLLDHIEVFELKYNINKHFVSVPQHLKEILASIKGNP